MLKEFAQYGYDNIEYDSYRYTKFALDKIAERVKVEKFLDDGIDGGNNDPWQRVKTPVLKSRNIRPIGNLENRIKYATPEYPGE